jgi:hypothetical protein
MGGSVARKKGLGEDPIITVKLRKGLADRQRLPLAHVLTVLEEFRLMIAETGRKIQAERGMENPTGDFGLEIIAGEHGALLKKGSVQAPLAITNNVQTGILAAQEICRVLATLEREDGVPDPNQEFDRAILRRVARVARVQRQDKLELQVSVKRPGFSAPMVATFGTAGMSSIRALQSPTFEVEGMSLYGKLVELVDRDESDEDGKGFWGELRRETGECWRVQFKPSDTDKVTPLFRKQVMVTGKAVYYRVATPKIIADSITQDTDRDYESAFDELFGCYKEVYNTDTKTLLKQLRED